MNDYDFQEDLQSVLQGDDYDCLFGRGKSIESVVTYDDAGVLTRDRGLVVRMGDGSVFMITIVQVK